ncbi:MAG TPA: hypothetical protein VHL32_09365, partial [Gemmatimonadaceae bacterium]|nr:hypothetical protein [Gemmatimonadaceae bacterium]
SIRLHLLLYNFGSLCLRIVFGRAVDGDPLNLMQALQEAFNSFWRDIACREILEVFEDLGVTVFELAVRLFAAVLPPILRKLGEEGFLEATIWKIARVNS